MLVLRAFAQTLTTLLLIAMLAACSSLRVSDNTSLYENLGGPDGVADIVDGLILEIAADDQLKAHFHRINIAGFRDRLEDFLCVISDGPCEYTGRDMRAAHANLSVRRVDFNKLVAGLIKVLEDQDLPYATENALLQRLARFEAEIVS